jgi:hypothetical protein
MKKEEITEEIEKCKDPAYFYETYVTVAGSKPAPLTEHQKEIMRELVKIKGGLVLRFRIPKNLGKKVNQ